MAEVMFVGLFIFALNGLMLIGANNKFRQSQVMLAETKQLALRVLARR